MSIDNELLKKRVKSSAAVFQRYFDGNLWYRLSYVPEGTSEDEVSFDFPVPISDIGNATFHNFEKPLLMMRYIRKHMEMLDKAKGE